MIVILTINGKGNRFLDAGIITPKFLLPYGEGTIISQIVENLKSGFLEDTTFYIGLNIDYKAHIPYLATLFKNNGMQHEFHLLEDTKGQADTVRVIIDKTQSLGEPMWVVNCDTLVRNNWRFDYSETDIIVETFESNLPLYSYVDNLKTVRQIAEKRVISKFASTGNYYFRDSRVFRDLFAKTTYNKEIFISDVIQCGVNENLQVKGIEVPSNNVKVLGTPAQYETHNEY